MIVNGIHNCSGLIDYINKIGFLPLLRMGIEGWSAEEAVDEECRYVSLPEGGWEWPLWEWKGDIIRESGCAYGKFFDRKAAFISREWWPDFCNWRRSVFPHPEEDSIEDMILQTLRENGSMITRDLRKACGFTGTKMRGKFDCAASSTPISHALKWDAVSSRKILSIRKTGTGATTAGAGRCSPRPKPCWEGTAAILTALPKSRAGGWNGIFKDCSRMRTGVCSTSC